MINGQVSWFDGDKPFKIDKPIRLIEFFAGYGSQHFALEYLGANFESWKICEWAVKSIQAYKDAHFGDDNTDYSKDLTKEELFEFLYNKGISANYNEPMTLEQIKRMGEDKARQVYNNIIATHNLVNIQQVKGKDLDIINTNDYCYILTYSFPCFTADSLVLTSDGYKRICDIENENLVLSHDNKYHKVINVFNNGTHDIYKINAMGVDEIKTTYNHKFYVREKYRKGHKSIRCFREPTWKELKDLTKNDYLGIAINQNNTSIVSNKLPMQHNSFWWLIGRYLGDGWLRQQGGIIICCDKKELGEITHHLDKLDWHYNIVEERTVYKIHIPKKALSEFCSQFGDSAGTKHLTKDVLDLPIHYLEPFIKGYMSADGCFTNGLYKATSISRELIYGIAQCVAKVYKTPYRIYKVEPPKTKIIEDRLVNQNNWYQLVFKTEKRKQDKAFYENGYIWYPINSIEYIGKDNVYDIEVEDSHSFTVQNTIVHNCQDLSSAGLGKGMEKGSGTRSGMLWEVERILDEIVADGGELPQVLLMENVPEVIGQKNISSFAKWIEKLDSLGYKNKWQVLNGKDFGIPQNRERCFMVSILGDYYYDFPKPMPLTLRLKDLLEKEVDEKFYLSDSVINYCIENTKKNKAKGNGFKFEPIEQNKCYIAKSITTCSGSRMTDNYIMSDVQFNHTNLKRELCNKLIKSGILKECDVVNHSYTNGGNGKNPNSRQTLEDYIETRNNTSPTLTTRPDVLGVVVKDEPIACELRCDEGIRTFEDNVMGTLRTIDACGGKHIIEPQVIGGVGEKKSNGGTQWYQQDRIYDGDVAIAVTTTCNPYYALKSENKRLKSLVEKTEFGEESLALDCFNQVAHQEVMHTIKTNVDKPNMNMVYNNLRIRKLVPIECFRLMGVKDEDFKNIEKNQSNASLFHLAGDSIIVNVLCEIFRKIL